MTTTPTAADGSTPARLAFVLPGYSWRPVGGFKVVYEYANRLAARGHRVRVLHPFSIAPQRGPRSLADRALFRLRRRLREPRPVPWFDVSPAVRLELVPDLGRDRLAGEDALVATAWQTAAPVAAAATGDVRGFYLVQDHELWSGSSEEIEATLRLPLHRLVIARFLGELAEQADPAQPVSVVPNGLDFEAFGVDVAPERRAPRVGFLLHLLAKKGTADAIAALEAVRGRVDGLEAVAFGVPERPAGLPAWLEYERLPDRGALRRLYNSCAVFVQPSLLEGWGLTATEAMLCGCALVTTDNGGSREYADHERTALVVPPGRPDLLSAAVQRALTDVTLRLRLAEAGRRHLAQFTWERATDSLERLLVGGGRIA